ncbi:MAG: histidine kinase [Bacteroidota bacterium]
MICLICVGGMNCGLFESSKFEPWPIDKVRPDDLEKYQDSEKYLASFSKLRPQQQIDSLLVLTDLLKSQDEDRAMIYAQKANEVAVVHRKPLSQAISLYYISLFKAGQDMYGEGIEDAIVDGEIGLKQFQKSDKLDWQIRTHRLISELFLKRGSSDARFFDSAKVHLEKGKILLRSEKISGQDSLVLLAEILHEQLFHALRTDTTDILTIYQECLTLHQLTGNRDALARLQQMLGLYFESKKDYDRAELLYRKGLTYAIESKDNHLLPDAYLRLGNVLIKQFRRSNEDQKFEEGLKRLYQCLNHQKENKYSTEGAIGRAFQIRANNRGELNYYDSALVHYQAAILSAGQEGSFAVMKANVTNVLRLCPYLSSLQYKSCEDILGIEPNAFINQNYDRILKGVTQNLEKANLRIQEREREEIETISFNKRRDQWLISGGVLVLTGLIFLLLLQQSQKRRLTAQMESLRAQINPHFISNSLNAIESLVNMGKNEAASKYLIHFSRLSRRILNSSRTPFVPLSDEIKTLQHFLALEQLRFRDKLQVQINVQEDIKQDWVIVPAMILQPYLENAIWHGIKPKVGIGQLVITIEQIGNQLVCSVEDDGIGRKKSRELQAATIMKRKSLGMQITQERLRINSKQKNTTIEIIDLEDADGNAKGTKVIVRLPYKTKKG